MNNLDGQSADITNEQLAKLYKVFPEAFSENEVDFDIHKSILLRSAIFP
ncbi:MAG: site-specific DNA-methyltransferase (Type III DNA modification enzyme) [Candidatus Nomurabacteria bacterium]|nr:site-specific DNA-methyltransferase (Type III DNA modification enzyme) [Candidatus Nomurabacteria bacterium]